MEKETEAQVFSCEVCETFKNTFFYRTSLVAAPEKVRAKWFCCVFQFFKLILKVFLIFKSNLELAISNILKGRRLWESKYFAVFFRNKNFLKFDIGLSVEMQTRHTFTTWNLMSQKTGEDFWRFLPLFFGFYEDRSKELPWKNLSSFLVVVLEKFVVNIWEGPLVLTCK